MKSTHMPLLASLLTLALVSASGASWGQDRAAAGTADNPDTRIAAPVASDGGRGELLQGAPVSEADDPVNRLVASETVDGLLLSITLDGATATLDSAMLARIPGRIVRPDRAVQGDRVEVRGLVDGQEVARTVVPDNVLNASEGDGLVRTTRRQIVAALAADRPLDSVQVRAAATGVDVVLDVSAAYAVICKAEPDNRWCPRQRGAPNTP